MDTNPQFLESLNAYLDGELNSNQKEKVERLLAEDPMARAMLEDLKQVSSAVHDLPKMAAPDDLSEGVLQQFERDLLLDRGGNAKEFAGQKHLRARNLVAAAAIFILCGAIAYIVFRVLQNPDNSFFHKENPNPIIAIDIAKTKPRAEKSPEHNTPVGSKLAATSSPGPGKPDIPAVALSHLEISVRSTQSQKLIQSLETTLRQQRIEQVVRTNMGNNEVQFAVLCPRSGFETIFRTLQQSSSFLALSVANTDNAAATMVCNATVKQAAILAGEANPALQQQQALVFSTENLAKAGKSTELTPDMIQEFVQKEPKLTNIRILGPTAEENTSLAPKNSPTKGSLSANVPDSNLPEPNTVPEALPTPKAPLAETVRTSLNNHSKGNDHPSAPPQSIPARAVALVITISPEPPADNSVQSLPDNSLQSPAGQVPPAAPSETSDPAVPSETIPPAVPSDTIPPAGSTDPNNP